MSMKLLLLLASLAWSADPEQLMREGRPVQALEAAQAQVRETPDDVEDHELLIDLMFSLGLGIQGELAYLQFADDNPGNPMAWYLLGRAALDPVRANTAYAKALSLDPTYARAMMGLAALQRAQGNTADAEKLYRQALELDKSLSEAWSGLGACLVQQERHAEALDNALAAMAAIPYDREGYLAAAVLEPDMALQHLQRGVKANPNDPELLAALGKLQIGAGEYKAARESLDKALAASPADPQANYDRAVVGELERGSLDAAGLSRLMRARALGEKAPVAAQIEVDALSQDYPDCYLVFLLDGMMKVEAGRKTEALDSLNKALELAPESPDVLGTMGLLLLALNDPQRAYPLLDKAYKARSWDVELGVSAGMAAAGALGANAGVTYLGQVAEAHPTELSPIMALVSLLTQVGRTDAAYHVLARATERFPHPTLLLSKAAAAQDLGRREEAAAILEELFQLTGDPKYEQMAQELRAQ